MQSYLVRTSRPQRLCGACALIVLNYACGSDANQVRELPADLSGASNSGDVETPAGGPNASSADTSSPSGSIGSGGDGSGGVATTGETGGASLGGQPSTGGVSSGGQSSTGGAAGATPDAGGLGETPSSGKLERVLVYSLTFPMDRGHNGNGRDEEIIEELATEHGFEAVITDDPTVFFLDYLRGFDALIFSSPAYRGQRIPDDGRAAIETYVREGGGWAGWHYALWIEHREGWDFMRVLGGGAVVAGHGPGPASRFHRMYMTIQDTAHPAVQGLGEGFMSPKEDWLRYAGRPTGPNTKVLARTPLLDLEEPSADGRYPIEVADSDAYPTMWVTEIDQGRSFYSMLGHGSSLGIPEAKTIIWNAMRWVARATE